MAQRRNKPYDLLILMAVEFLSVVLVFYSAAIMLIMAYGASLQTVLDTIGSGAAQMLYDDPVQVITALGWMFAILAGATMLVIWGLFKAKKFAYLLGLVVAFLTCVVSVIGLLLFGFNNLQQSLRFILSAALPLVAIFYLVKPPIQDYLMPGGRK